MKKSIMTLFLILLVIPNFLFYNIFFKGEQEFSSIEQRSLNHIPVFSFDDFINNKFQTNLESGISDQIFISDKIKNKYYNSINNINIFTVNIFDLFFDLSQEYINIKDSYYIYGNSNYIVEKQINISNSCFDYFSNLYSMISYPGVEKYIYFINKDNSTDFSSNTYNKYNNLIIENFDADYYGFFNINSFEEYKKYFYQTDHHWNHLGAYKGYNEIIRMMLGEDEELIEPISTHEYDYIYNGSYARLTGMDNSTEKFTVYNFPKQTYKRYSNGFLINQKLFNISEGEKYTHYYMQYYDSLPLETLYDYSDSSKQNLLVITNSFVDAINDLIASHFNKTYYLEIRYSESFYNKEFFEKYISEREIDKILIVGDMYFFCK